jgi:hypothetical protein
VEVNVLASPYSANTLLEDAVYCSDLAQTAESFYDFPMAMIFYQEAYYSYEAAGALPEAKAILTRYTAMMDIAFR